MKFTTGNTVVTFEKLWYLQRAHAERYVKSDHGTKILLMTKPILEVLKKRNWINSKNCVLGRHDAESYVTKLVQLDARNYTNASAFVERNKVFFQAPDEQTLLISRPSGHLHHISKDMSSVIHQDEVLQHTLSNLELIPPAEWTADQVREVINATIAEQTELSLKFLDGSHYPGLEGHKKIFTKSWSKLVHGYIRWAIAAGLPGPDGAGSMQILGREETLNRFANAVRILGMKRPDGGADLKTKVAEAHKPA